MNNHLATEIGSRHMVKVRTCDVSVPHYSFDLTRIDQRFQWSPFLENVSGHLFASAVLHVLFVFAMHLDIRYVYVHRKFMNVEKLK